MQSQRVSSEVAPTLGRLLESRVVGDYRRLLLNATEVESSFESCEALVEAVRVEFAADIPSFVRQRPERNKSLDS